MADLSKIKLNGTNYDLKDAYIRDNLKLLPILYYEKYNDWENIESPILYKDYNYSEPFTFNELYSYGGDTGLVWLNEFDGDNHVWFLSTCYFTINYSNYRSIIELESQTENNIIKWHIGYKDNDDQAYLYYDEIISIPTLEPMANVEAMLTSYGLNASANLQSAAAGTAEIGKAVVQ